jgi:hypothetical protein
MNLIFLLLSFHECVILGIRKAPTPKWMLRAKVLNVLLDTASPVDQTGGAFLFMLIFSLIEKGKQCNNQTTKGYQQADNPYEYQNDICSCHEHHLLRSASVGTGQASTGRLVPCHGYFSVIKILSRSDRNFNIVKIFPSQRDQQPAHYCIRKDPRIRGELAYVRSGN